MIMNRNKFESTIAKKKGPRIGNAIGEEEAIAKRK
jgi:hypothetical protein